jgi:hypothetical protein
MRISGISGLVSAMFLAVVLPVALIFVYHYWREETSKGIGQRKKRRIRKLKRRWVLVAIVACGVGLAGAAIYYLVPNISIVQIPARGRAYVHVSDARLETLEKDHPMVLHILVENTGTVEATGYFKDITCQFGDIDVRSLPYKTSGLVMSFKLAPNDKVEMRMPFESPKLDESRLKMLNENRAGLFFYAHGEYRDEAGTKYQVSFCRQYTTFFPSYLAFCSDSITFKEPEAVNQ